ncbi:hypothetical protein KKH39_03035 [Patescibacteria group bacterium]|nr:hypothetical protein [Patescibacteria group bacterium]
MKTSHSIVFFVIILLVGFSIFLFVDHKEKNKPDIVRYKVGCDSDKIEASIYGLSGNTSRIGAMIKTKEQPISQENKDKLSDLGVFLDEASSIFDYVRVEIPTEKLCDLAQLDFVVSIFNPETKEDTNLLQ